MNSSHARTTTTNAARLATACAFLALSVSSAHALDILYVGTSNDTAFRDYVATQFTGVTWTHKAQGTGADQIGGDLDVSRSFNGTTVSVRDYVNGFDLVILGVPNTSTQFQQGADWAAVTAPLLVTNSTIARASGTPARLGFFSGDNTQNPLTFGAADETTRVSASALSDRLFARTLSPANLYLKADTDTISSVATIGGGEVITRFASGTVGVNAVTNSFGLTYWESGAVGGGGLTFAADRAFLPMKGGFAVDFTADGQIVMANLISELSGVAVIPEPSSFAALAGASLLGLAATRRRRRA